MSRTEKELLKLRQEIYQANPIIQACKKMDITEMRIFFLGLRGINPHLSRNDKVFDVDFKEIFIPTEKLAEIFGNTWYLSQLKETCKKLFSKDCIELDRENGGFCLVHLFRRLEYVPNEGLYIWFDDLMRPYLLDLLEKSYTKISVEQIFYLSSPYAMRLLELMLQYQNMPGMNNIICRTLTVEEVRFALNVPTDAYSGRMNNFTRFVLDNPIAEINRQTKYKMSYTAIKHGKKTIKFEFSLDVSALKSNLPNEPENISGQLEPPKKERPMKKAVSKSKFNQVELSTMINAAFKSMPEKNTSDNYFGLSEEELRQQQKILIEKDAETAGLKPGDFREGEHPVFPGMIDYIKKQMDNPTYQKNLLTTYGLTIERFKELYC